MLAYTVKRSVCTYHYAFSDEDRRAIAHVSTEDFEFDPAHKDQLDPHTLVKVVVETDCGRKYGEDSKGQLVPTKAADNAWMLELASDKAFEALELEGDVVGQHTGCFADAVWWRGKKAFSIWLDITVSDYSAEVTFDFEPQDEDSCDWQCRTRVRLPDGEVRVLPEVDGTMDFDMTEELFFDWAAKAVLSVCEPEEA